MLNTKRSTYYASAPCRSTYNFRLYSSVYGTKTCGVELNRGAGTRVERGAGCLVELSNPRGAGNVELAAATEPLPRQNMLNSCRRECKCFLRTMKNDNKKNHNEMLSAAVNEKPANVFILFTLPESFKKRH